MYSTIKAKEYNNSVSKFMSGGLNKDVIISGYKTDTSINGNKFIETTFEKNGATISKTEWEPTLWEGDKEDALEKKQTNLVNRLTQILECYYPSDASNMVFEGETFSELAKWYIDNLDKADKTTKLNIKVVYDKNGYATLPTYSKYPFIEPAIKPETWTRPDVEIRGNDQISRPVIADERPETTNPFSESVKKDEDPIFTVNRDGLPF